MVHYSTALLSAAVVGLASTVAALPTDIKTSKNVAVGIPVLLDSNVPLNTTFPGNENELVDYEDDPFPDDLEVELENPAGLEERDLEKRMTATQYWRQTCVGRHNQARQQVGVPQLQYDTGLEAKACKWGAYLAQYNKFEHGSTGENLYKAWSSQAFDDTKKLKSCQTATDSWWREISYYRYGQKVGTGNFHAYGHYTQLIWKKSQRVGCCAQRSGDRRTNVVVCRYDPPGNYINQLPY
ncbi:uncharacterized protein SPPG_04905 [Spizellomyces punctatus DAOM BR117]|uniref:SCP domain-containing protein n=1 Tax=Spizellomyces punctatus (strain DAOM BR117) TaxID=645134 RepID=A0A0L0HEV0_SPIPD|nr:uncharacterized protein SPPG_04905 [Spizellomyces punctatus DAOM BR117]KNC99514.1 hypothetical protein SPPG_04905 [Spizellomyces punctatus DAOM BR117]|eukprot:XP_016607554.1 hypothetical protein SPPG_04905 [Spizellomyces punctatus DAOM BR117]